MDVAVIIPMYNGAKFIRRTLEAVCAQSHRPSEIVVVDDGSSDESAQIVQSFDGVRLIANQGEGKGAHFARDFGLKQTTAPFVTFLDQDDIWHPDHLRILSNLLLEYPDCNAVVSGARQFQLGQDVELPQPPEGRGNLFDPWKIFPFSCQPTPSAVLFRRSALEAIGGWPTHCLPSDYYVCMRLGADKPLLKNDCDTLLRCKHARSHGATLYQNVLNTVNRFQACLTNLLPYRLAAHPQDQEVLSRRLAAFSSISRMLEAASTSDQALLAESAIAFEKNLAPELPDFVDGMILLIVVYARPSDALLDSLFKQLMTDWPQAAHKTRLKLIPLFPTKALLRNVRRFAWNPRCWPVLGSALLTKGLSIAHSRFQTLAPQGRGLIPGKSDQMTGALVR